MDAEQIVSKVSEFVTEILHAEESELEGLVQKIMDYGYCQSVLDASDN